MNNNEIRKIMILKKEIQEFNAKVRELNHFLRTYESSFVNENSIEALSRIEKFKNELISKCIDDKKSIQKISESINCSHELIVKDFLEDECPMCKRRFKHDEKSMNVKYVVSSYYNYDEDEKDINCIVLDAKDETDACESLLEYFGKKQICEKIYIRRLLK